MEDGFELIQIHDTCSFRHCHRFPGLIQFSFRIGLKIDWTGELSIIGNDSHEWVLGSQIGQDPLFWTTLQFSMMLPDNLILSVRGPVANRPLLRSRRATRIGWPQRTSPKSSKFFWPRILMRRCVVAMTKSPRSWRHSKLCSVISPIWACCKQQQSRSYAPNNRIWSSSVFTGWQFMGWVWS